MSVRQAAQIALAAALLAGAIAGCGGSGASLTYHPPRLGGGWPYPGRDRDNTRYAPQTQISAANIRHLGIAWRHRPRREDAYLSESSPIVVDNTIYLTTPTDGWKRSTPQPGTPAGPPRPKPLRQTMARRATSS